MDSVRTEGLAYAAAGPRHAPVGPAHDPRRPDAREAVEAAALHTAGDTLRARPGPVLPYRPHGAERLQRRAQQLLDSDALRVRGRVPPQHVRHTRARAADHVPGAVPADLSREAPRTAPVCRAAARATGHVRAGSFAHESARARVHGWCLHQGWVRPRRTGARCCTCLQAHAWVLDRRPHIPRARARAFLIARALDVPAMVDALARACRPPRDANMFTTGFSCVCSYRCFGKRHDFNAFWELAVDRDFVWRHALEK
mmetsp:Transcript_65278/g.183805  ORF Transcript_65278/g.183805 Transcript_65278/m.183805 type:complete len:256 (-) Transcript_65278:1-768(-)